MAFLFGARSFVPTIVHPPDAFHDFFPDNLYEINEERFFEDFFTIFGKTNFVRTGTPVTVAFGFGVVPGIAVVLFIGAPFATKVTDGLGDE